MFLPIYDLFHRHAAAYNREPGADLSADYALPAVIEWGDWRMVLNNRAQVADFGARYGEFLSQSGVTRVSPKVSAVELPRRGRFRVWVTWVLDTVAGPGSASSQIVYYCRKEGKRTLIEMQSCPQSSANAQAFLQGSRAA